MKSFIRGSVIKALVLAKIVLVAETLRLCRGFEDKPLVVPTLCKTVLFTLCCGVFNIAEWLVRESIKGLGLMGAIDEVMSRVFLLHPHVYGQRLGESPWKGSHSRDRLWRIRH